LLGRQPLLGQQGVLLCGELLHGLGGGLWLWLPHREGGLLLLPGLPGGLELLGRQRRLLLDRLHLLLHGLADRCLLGVLLAAAALHLAPTLHLAAAAALSAALHLAPAETHLTAGPTAGPAAAATSARTLGRRRVGPGAKHHPRGHQGREPTCPRTHETPR
jgi:hypothetical protein